MAGHSKWANIKRHKAKQDSKRGKLYTKLIREITVAAKMGGADASANPRLRAALDKAFEANMTKDVIERAIKRGVGGMEGEELEEIRYEGYGPSGIAIMVECLTNNRNRTVAEVRHAFTKFGGNLGLDGSVAYLFKKQGQFTFAPGLNQEKLLETALELRAIDVVINDDESLDVISSPEDFTMIKSGLIKAGFNPAQSEVTYLPNVSVPINDSAQAETISGLIDALEDLDDVQSVYTNADIAIDLS